MNRRYLIAIASLSFASLVLSSRVSLADAVYAWGRNTEGELGDGTTVSKKTPVLIGSLPSGVTAIAGNGYHSLAIANGTVYSWGSNTFGQIGDGTTTPRTSPVSIGALPSNNSAAIIGAGGTHSLAVDSQGALFAWGGNIYGQLGDGTNAQSSSPLAITALSSGVTSIVGTGTGSSQTLAIVGGSVYAWGANNFGQLGVGTTVNSNIPLQVPTLTSGATAVAGGTFHSLAVVNGAVYSWGFNLTGQLGNGNNTNTSTPGMVISSGASAVAAGVGHSLALVNGNVYAWGVNSVGQLGRANPTSSNVPLLVSTLPANSITAIAAGENSSYALASDGTLWAWGLNNFGQLGNGNTSNQLSPVHLLPPAGTHFTAVVGEFNSVLAMVAPNLVPVPEPAALLLLASGLAMAAMRRQPRKS